uniref:Leucine-rich repeat-containing protein 40 n=1 Tax=Amphimedon queenslandica TaxID=400682 RepID=A0A1X7VRP1_AMPQE
MSSSRGASKKSPAGSTRLKPNPNFFNSPSQSDGVGKEGTVPESLLKEARKTGSLNLSNRLNIDPPDGSTVSFERWWDQVELTRLDLSSNKIKEISEHIENFNSLSALEVQYNELTCLPNNVIILDKLSRIFASCFIVVNLLPYSALIWRSFILAIGGFQAESPILKPPIINAHAQ